MRINSLLFAVWMFGVFIAWAIGIFVIAPAYAGDGFWPPGPVVVKPDGNGGGRIDGALTIGKKQAATVDQLASGFVPEGSWAESTSYTTGDLVSNDGSSYVCSADHTSASTDEPGTGASWENYWTLVSEKGEQGKTIANGSGAPDDANGANGDFYIDTSVKCIYGPKSDGVWPDTCTPISPIGGSGALIITSHDQLTTPSGATPSGYTSFYTKDGKLCSYSVVNGEVCIGSGAGSFVSVPESAAADGSVGQWSADSNYVYFCYAENSWIRVANDDTWVTSTCATPTASPAAGSYSTAQTVFLSSTTADATICYTTDGSTPTGDYSGCTNGTEYSSSFSVDSTSTVKAIAFKQDYEDSGTMSATYVIGGGAGAEFVQHAYVNSASTSDGTVSAAAFSSANTAGNAIIVFANGSDAAPLSCSDTQGNTYTRIAATEANVSTYDNPGVIFYATGIAGGSGNVVTCIWEAASHSFVNVSATEVSGITTLDQAGAIDDGSGSITGPALTTTQDGEFIFSAIVKPSSVTAGSESTLIVNGSYFATEYAIQASAGSITPTFTGSMEYSFHVATFY